MPTYDLDPRFGRDFDRSSRSQQRAFRAAVALLVADFRAGRAASPQLRMKAVQGHDGVFEISFAPDGRASFHFGAEVRPGHQHIVWRRIGTHDIFRNP